MALPPQPQQQATAATYSYTNAPRPWKNPAKAKTTARRTKTLKQIMALERERVDKLAKELREREEAIAAGQMDTGEGPVLKWNEMVTPFTVEAPPSLLPAKKYCDVTGLEAKYTDPKSTLRYHNPEVYEVIKTFQPAVIQAYLSLRGQGVVLR